MARPSALLGPGADREADLDRAIVFYRVDDEHDCPMVILAAAAARQRLSKLDFACRATSRHDADPGLG